MNSFVNKRTAARTAFRALPLQVLLLIAMAGSLQVHAPAFAVASLDASNTTATVATTAGSEDSHGNGGGSSGAGGDGRSATGDGEAGNAGARRNGFGNDPRVDAGLQRLMQAAKQYRSRLPGGQTLLKPRQLHRALYGGDLERIRNFVRRMVLGEPVTLALMGGSVSKGMGAVAGEPSMEAWLAAWLAEVAPVSQEAGAAAEAAEVGGAELAGLVEALRAGGVAGALAAVAAEGNATLASTVRLVNAACPATNSAYMNMCLMEYLRDPNVDLVVVEYAINDEPFPQPHWDNEPRRSFELLLRKLLRLPRRPAVVLLNTYRWNTDFMLPGPEPMKPSKGVYYTNTESQYFEFATYYGLPMLSVKAAAYHQMVAGVRGFQVDQMRFLTRPNASSDPTGLFYEDAMHPSGLTGHRVLSELVIALLLHAARSLEARPWRQSEEEYLRAPLPPPMIPSSAASSSNGNAVAGAMGGEGGEEQEDDMGQWDQCLLGDNLRAAAVEEQGFMWLDEGRNPRAPKWGFTSTTPGASVTFQPLTSTARAKTTGTGTTGTGTGVAANDTATFALVILAYLRSYEQMGVAEVTCQGTCVCGQKAREPEAAASDGNSTLAGGSGGEQDEVVLRLDGHWEQRTSQLQLACFPALLTPECRVVVRVAANTSSGQHKVKLGGLIVSHSSPNMAQAMCYENLEAAQRAAGFRER